MVNNKERTPDSEETAPDLGRHGPSDTKFRESRYDDLVDALSEGELWAAEEGYPEIGKFIVQRVLSNRGRAQVFLAFDPDLKRQVILKVFPAELGDQEKLEIINEGRALSAIDNPFVVKCFGVESLVDCPYLVNEFVPGLALDEYAAEHQLSDREILSLILQICKGVNAIHAAGLLHRDLKPSNVIISAKDKTPKIIDFGLARNSSKTFPHETSGTTAYMPPERARNEIELIDHRSDIFGIGGIHYFLLTGRPPFDAPTDEDRLALAKVGQMARPSSVANDVSRNAEAICLKCLEFDHRSRPEDVDELIRLIERAIRKMDSSWALRLAGLAASVFLICSLAILAFVQVARNDNDSAGRPPAQFTAEKQVDAIFERAKAATLEDAAVRRDFEIEFWLTDAGIDKKLPDAAVKVDTSDPNGRILLIRNHQYLFTFRPRASCYLALFSLEGDSSSAGIVRCDRLYPKNRYQLERIRAGEQDAIKLVNPTPASIQEYLLVVASNRPWTERLLEKPGQSDESSDAGSRGVDSEDHELVSVYLLPYVVEEGIN